MLPRKATIRMEMDGEPLLCIDQLDEQTWVRAHDRDMVRTEKGLGITANGIPQGRAVRKNGESEVTAPDDTCRGSHPVLGQALAVSGRGPPKSGQTGTAAVGTLDEVG